MGEGDDQSPDAPKLRGPSTEDFAAYEAERASRDHELAAIVDRQGEILRKHVHILLPLLEVAKEETFHIEHRPKLSGAIEDANTVLRIIDSPKPQILWADAMVKRKNGMAVSFHASSAGVALDTAWQDLTSLADQLFIKEKNEPLYDALGSVSYHLAEYIKLKESWIRQKTGTAASATSQL